MLSIHDQIKNASRRSIKIWGILSFAASVLAVAAAAQGNSVTWKGYTWSIKSASEAGPGPNNWNASNVFVDAKGFLHLQITSNSTSGKWYCAELYTTNNLGFGTYQWQIESSIDAFDPWVVLGLFPYGPPALGPDGSNEIDIEYSRWGKAGGNNGWWTVYPDSGTNTGQESYSFHLAGTYTTSRFTWSNKEISYWLMGGFQPAGTTVNVIHSWSYAPTNSYQYIPQHAMPLHMNFWLRRGHAPSNGRPAEVIIHDFRKM